MQNIDNMVKLKIEKKEEIQMRKQEILMLEKQVKDINRELWKNCNHDFEKVSWDHNDLLKRRCKVCKLWQHEYLYR